MTPALRVIRSFCAGGKLPVSGSGACSCSKEFGVIRLPIGCSKGGCSGIDGNASVGVRLSERPHFCTGVNFRRNFCRVARCSNRVADSSPTGQIVIRRLHGGSHRNGQGRSLCCSIAKCRGGGLIRPSCRSNIIRCPLPLFHVTRVCLGCTRTLIRVKRLSGTGSCVSGIHMHTNVPGMSRT